MGDNKDLRKKIEGQLKALEEHRLKEEKYTDPRDKEFARKTQIRIKKEIADLVKRLSPAGYP